jgi:hypothetical protein
MAMRLFIKAVGVVALAGAAVIWDESLENWSQWNLIAGAGEEDTDIDVRRLRMVHPDLFTAGAAASGSSHDLQLVVATIVCMHVHAREAVVVGD